MTENEYMRKQIDKLTLRLRVYKYGYYVHHTSIVPDQKYDLLERCLRDMEIQYGYKNLKSATETVGSVNYDEELDKLLDYDFTEGRYY